MTRALLLALLGGLLGCSGGGSGSPARCRDEQVPLIPDPGASAALVATITVFEEEPPDAPADAGPDAGPDATPGSTAHATAAFVDRSVRVAGDTPAFAFGRDCVPGGDPSLCPCLGIIGRPAVRREAMPLDVDHVAAEGVVGGSLTLTKRSAGHYMGGPEARLFGDEPVTVRVEGAEPAGVVLARAGEDHWASAEIGPRRLWAVWIGPGGTRLAVGAAGTAFVDRGGGFEALDTGLEADLTAVHGLADDEAWVVGAGGAVLRWDGEALTPEESGTEVRLEAVLALPGEVHAAGAEGICLGRGADGSWSPEPTPVSRDVYGLADLGGGRALAVGSGGLLLEWTGSEWREGTSGVGVDLLDVFVDDSGRVTVVGRGGMVLRDEGAGFEVETSGVDRDLQAVAGDGSSLLLAAGQAGVLLARWPDGAWLLDGEPEGADLQGLAVGPDGEALAVGFTATFPSFATTGAPPERLGAPTLEGSVEAGEVVVRWEGGGAGYVDLLLSTEAEDDPSLRNRLRCIVADDGCHSITRDALDWLVSGTGRRAAVRVERHELVLTSVDEQSAAVLDLVRAVSFAAEL